MKRSAKYEERVTVFLDILGFKNMINATVKNGNVIESEFNKIIAMYEIINLTWKKHPISKKEYRSIAPSKQVTIFSDSVVISFKTHENSQVFFTLLEIHWMLMNLVNIGILCRGAVTIGKLSHNSKQIFGPALVEAYQMESKQAIYPRVLVSKDVIEKGSQFGENDKEEEKRYIKKLLAVDDDGNYYIDFIESVQSELDDPEYGMLDYIEKLRFCIEALRPCNDFKLDDSIKEKFEWLKKKFNEFVLQCHNELFIEYLRKNNDSKIAEYYQNLIFIK